jgi:hypothetical protein
MFSLQLGFVVLAANGEVFTKVGHSVILLLG